MMIRFTLLHNFLTIYSNIYLLGVYIVGSFSWKFIGNNGKLALKCMKCVGNLFYRFLCKWEHNEVLFSKKFERRRRNIKKNL